MRVHLRMISSFCFNFCKNLLFETSSKFFNRLILRINQSFQILNQFINLVGVLEYFVITT